MALSHSPSIITNGLVLCLDAANTKPYPGSGTTWTDLSGNGNNGTLVNSVGYDSANGGSLSLNGSSDYVRIPNASISKNCSICFWFKDNNPGAWSDLFTFQTGSDGTASRVEKHGGIAYQYNWYQGGFANGTVLFNHLGTNFDYICLVFDAQNATCYQNAVQTAQSSSSNFGSASFIDFGKRISIYNWNGNIAQVTIYNRPLTPSEVTQNYNALKGRYGL